MTQQTGTELNDQLTGTAAQDLLVGGGGDDVMSGGAANDMLVGDYTDNLLATTGPASSFGDYSETSAWTVTRSDDGHSSMTQTLETTDGAAYQLTFDLANNFATGNAGGAIEVLWNGEVIETIETQSGVFEDITLNLTGNGPTGELTFRTTDPQTDSPIDTSGPIYSYETEMIVGGETITVNAFAEGQTNLYQVLNGTLMVFDPVAETYTQAGADATVTVNAIGFNQEDNMIYGIAVGNGVDALGNPVTARDLVMIDADGNSYGMGATPYRSWTGDFDDQGNLWAFEADMDYFMSVDVSEQDANGNPLVTRYDLPDELVNVRVWDVAFDAASGTFQGVVRPNAEGAPATLITIDVSGSTPSFELTPVTSTTINGVTHEGAPAITFGAAIIDTDGTLYVGGNSGDHDMNDATGSAGGFYSVAVDPATGEAALTLVAEAPRSWSNDGAADPRAGDPFAPADVSSTVLIQDIALVDDPAQADSFDDAIDGNAGNDTINGNLGDDVLVGSSAGDSLSGGAGDDFIFGGAGPDAPTSGIISIYHSDGSRYDQFGNLLEEDDDVLNGGAGDDIMNGSAGHDNLSGGAGQDRLSGGSGHDVLLGGDDADELYGGSENDHLSGNAGEDALFGGSGNDTLDGGTGADKLKGGSGNDDLSGGDANDELRGDAGDDILSGGDGNDKLNGGSGADIMTGDAGKDYLNGGKGDDILDGGAGKDRLYLGAGDDIATGGAGSDRFVFRKDDVDGGTDRITDFSRDSSQSDRIDLTQLNLLDGGLTAEEWVAQNLSLSSDGTVSMDLEGTTVLFDARDDGTAKDLFQDITDGLMF